MDAWGNVHTYYDQVTYGTLDVQADALSSWTTLTGTTNDYVTFSGAAESPNIKSAALPRLMAEAAKACQDAGFNLNDYQILACVLYLNGQFIRAWGGWSQQSFSYSNGAGTNINITLNQSINLLAIQESADWGRFAHETGHNIVAAPNFGSSPGAATLSVGWHRRRLSREPLGARGALRPLGGTPICSLGHLADGADDRQRTLNPRVQGSSPWGDTYEMNVPTR